jgi:flagellar assembly protein FliH
MPAAPARFTFDLDLGRREERGRMLTENVLAEMLRSARMEGFAQGFAEAEQGVDAVAARHIAEAAEALADRASAMAAAIDDARRMTLAEAAELALSVGRKLALHLIARQPAAELAALVEECMGSLDGVPHLVIRCHPGVADAIRATAEARMSVTGFSGRLVVIGDPQIGLSDGRMEWADGGLARDLKVISAEIDRAVAAFVAGARSNSEEVS